MILNPELIRVRRKKGTITPLYANEQELSLAKTLISIFKDFKGKTRKELREALLDCEELGYDYKLVRGLSSVLEDKCYFDSITVVKPLEARKLVFSEAGQQIVSNVEQRNKIMAKVAFLLGISTIELEQSLFADLDDEHILTRFDEPIPMDLLKEYNFALIIGLATYGKRIDVTFSGIDKVLENFIKRLGDTRFSSLSGKSRIIAEWSPGTQSGYRGMLLKDIFVRLLDLDDWILTASVVFPLKVGKTYRLIIRGDIEGKTMSYNQRKEIPLIPTTSFAIKPKKTSQSRKKKTPSGGLVIIDEIAHKMKLTEDEVREIYHEESLLDLGNILISKELKKRILDAIDSAPDMKLNSISKTLKGLGVKQPVSVLMALGFEIDWNRNRKESLVYRI